MRVRILVLSLWGLVLGGCAFRQHATFCGPGYPQMPKDWTVEQRLAHLEKTPPVDDIDAACKAHDICYLNSGSSEKVCDDALVEAVEKLQLRMSCHNMAGDISTWFIAFHPSVERDNTAGNFSRGFSGVVASPLIGSLVVMHGISQLWGRAGRDEPCCDRVSFMSNPDGPCYPRGESAVRLRTMQALIPFASEERLYYEPQMPANLVETVRRQARVPSDERVVAVLTGAVFGFRDTIVFTESGIYFKSFRTAGAVSYAEVDQIEPIHSMAIKLNGTYDISMNGMDAKTIEKIILTVRDSVTEASSGS